MADTVTRADKPRNLKNFSIALFTFFLVNVTWVFFRSSTFTKAWDVLRSMFGFSGHTDALLPTLSILKVSIIISLMVITHWLMRNTKVLDLIPKISWWAFGIGWAVLLLLLIWSQESSSSFIYFQF